MHLADVSTQFGHCAALKMCIQDAVPNLQEKAPTPATHRTEDNENNPAKCFRLESPLASSFGATHNGLYSNSNRLLPTEENIHSSQRRRIIGFARLTSPAPGAVSLAKACRWPCDHDGYSLKRASCQLRRHKYARRCPKSCCMLESRQSGVVCSVC